MAGNNLKDAIVISSDSEPTGGPRRNPPRGKRKDLPAPAEQKGQKKKRKRSKKAKKGGEDKPELDDQPMSDSKPKLGDEQFLNSKQKTSVDLTDDLQGLDLNRAKKRADEDARAEEIYKAQLIKILEDLQKAKFEEMLWTERQDVRDTTITGEKVAYRNTAKEEDVIRKRNSLINRLQRQVEELTKEREEVWWKYVCGIEELTEADREGMKEMRRKENAIPPARVPMEAKAERQPSPSPIKKPEPFFNNAYNDDGCLYCDDDDCKGC